MTEENGGQRTVGGLKGMRRKAVDTTQLVKTSFLEGRDERLPIIVTPALGGVDLAGWCTSNRAELDSFLDRFGGVLFRGFGLSNADDFERIAGSVSPDLYADYGDLPSESESHRIYSSTPYPADKMILFHNESSHLATWPLRQFFFCVVPSSEGGNTPLIDCRELCDALDPDIVAAFERKGLVYVRNFSEGIDVPWQEFFHTSDKAAVEESCAREGMACEWTADGGLRIRNYSPGVTTHPRTGERVFFNQVQLHHVACLDAETRTAMEQLFSGEDLPRNVLFGDGSPIPDEMIERIGRTFEDVCVEFPWQTGDLIVLDNMLVSHARRPFSGERKLLVAMAEMTGAPEPAGVDA
jgi:alpha-ketoglutarate-dependent taurine dioxygenase